MQFNNVNWRICAGPGNPAWDSFLEHNGVKFQKKIAKETIKYIEGCDVLDGNFEMIVAGNITDEFELCKSVRNLKIITGFFLIHAYPGKSLRCFEQLQQVLDCGSQKI